MDQAQAPTNNPTGRRLGCAECGGSVFVTNGASMVWCAHCVLKGIDWSTYPGVTPTGTISRRVMEWSRGPMIEALLLLLRERLTLYSRKDIGHLEVDMHVVPLLPGGTGAAVRVELVCRFGEPEPYTKA